MRRPWIALWAMTLLFGCGDEYPVRPGGGADIPSALRLVPANTMTSLGSEFTARVEVVDAQELFGIAFEVTYDASLLELVSVSAGSALGGDVLFFEESDLGRISVAVTKKRGAAALTGSGTVASLRFRAVGAGRSNLSFDQPGVEPAGVDGLVVSNIERFVVQSGSVNVLQGE